MIHPSGLPFLPRSPRWLAKVGRSEEAIQALANIQSHGDTSDPLVVAEWEEIWTVLQAEREGVQGWRKFFKVILSVGTMPCIISLTLFSG